MCEILFHYFLNFEISNAAFEVQSLNQREQNYYFNELYKYSYKSFY